MSEPSKDSLSELLSSFALGPSWAKATAASQPAQAAQPQRESNRPDRRQRDGQRDDRREGRRDFDRDDRRDGPPRKPLRGRGPDRRDDQRLEPPREALPADGVRVTLIPDAEAVHLIGKEVHQVARVYPLFDVARILLAERSRCRAVFEAPEPHPPLLRGKLDDSIFLTRAEAVRHLWHSELRQEFIEEETIEVDPPAGNFQLVARCGISGEWLGPPNFHTYQTNLRRIHRERFPHMSLQAYTAKVRTERGEEAVNAWLETQRQKTRWRLKDGDPEAWVSDRADAERILSTACFDKAFEETRRIEVLASIPPAKLSPALMISLKLAGNHARNHPAILIPAVCKALENEHLPVFKRQGKLFTGPARPHPLPADAVLAERPGIMVNWIRANPPAKLEGLWQAVLPDGATAPPAEFAADLFWLLHQGHILLFTDDTLVVQEIRPHGASNDEAEPKSGKKKKKPKSPKTKPAAETTASPAADQSPAAEDETPTQSDTEPPAFIEAPVVQGPVVEPPVVESPDIQAPSVETDFSIIAEESPKNHAPAVDDNPPL